MRIISGKYKGRKLEGFTIDGTRPTMDRVKESLFGSIQNYLKDAYVLDLFAGSGSLGLEALSNGAKEVYLIDNNNIAINTINNNSKNMDGVNILKTDYQKYLKHCNKKFDIIFLDPPYDLNLINPSLELIKKYSLLNENGIIVCEYEKEQINPIYNIIKEKKYSSTNIMILKNVNNNVN